MAIRMDGRALAEETKARLARQAAGLPRPPGLAVVLAGEDAACEVYVRGKEQDCARCGIRSVTCRLPADAGQEDLLEQINALNRREDVDGILVQLPLPGRLSPAAVLRAIDPEKDVDCVHPYNVGRLHSGQPACLPCTPAAVLALMRHYGIRAQGRRCVVLGRSDIVGKPLAALLTQEDGTVTLCHSKTRDLGDITRQADILVSAVGRAGTVTAEMVKPGAAVIDVAVNRRSGGGLCGDADFDAVEQTAGWITPVPGGVGPVTRAMLMENVLAAARRRLCPAPGA